MKNSVETSVDECWKSIREIAESSETGVLVINNQNEVLMTTPNMYSYDDLRVFGISLVTGLYEDNSLALVCELRPGTKINIKVG